MGDLTRRAFIGRTLLTGATIATGGLSTISTSPKTPTVAKVATNVFTPKAKAYRRFLKGIRTLDYVASRTPLGDGSNKGISTGKNIKSLITKSKSDLNVVNQNKGGKNLARRAFSAAIGPGDRVGGNYIKGAVSVFSDEIMRKIAPQHSVKRGYERNLTQQQTERVWKVQNLFSENIHKEGRKVYGKEFRKQLKINKKSKKMLLNIKISEKGQKTEKIPTAKRTTKLRGGGGGGGKMALPGLESAKNPTGMSLVAQRYTL